MLFRDPILFPKQVQPLANHARLIDVAGQVLLSLPRLCDREPVLEPSKPMIYQCLCRLAPLSDDDR